MRASPPMMMAINIPARIIVLPYEDLPAWSNEGEYRRVPNGPPANFWALYPISAEPPVAVFDLSSCMRFRPVRCVSDLAAVGSFSV